MSLLNVFLTFFVWFYQVFKTFLKVRPVLSVIVVIIAVVAKVTRLIAFLLPLKVIILAGSDGVPKYFLFLINPEQKIGWIVALSIISVVAYLITVFLESIDRQLCEKGAKAIVNYANRMAVMSNQSEASFNVFSGFTGLAANLVFTGGGVLLVALILPQVALVFVGLSISLFTMTAILLDGASLPSGNFFPRNPTQAWILGKVNQYVSILTSTVFLASFLVILYPYLTGDGPNIIISLVCFVVLRQVVNAVSGAINQAVKQSRNKVNVNSLVFRRFQVQQRTDSIHKRFEEKYCKSKRDQILQEQIISKINVDTYWQDSSSPDVSHFMFNRDTGDESHIMLWQVFFPKYHHLLDREEFLFNHISRSRLKAPTLELAFTLDKFRNQLLNMGKCIPVSTAEFNAMVDDLRDYYYCLQVSSELVQAYRLTHPLLHQQLEQNDFSSLKVALDTPRDVATLHSFSQKLSELCKRIKQLPLVLSNPSISARHIYWKDESKTEIIVESWRKWSLIPIGADLRNKKQVDLLISKLPDLQCQREDLQSTIVTAENVWLAALMTQLVRSINGNQFKKSLRTMNQMLEVVDNLKNDTVEVSAEDQKGTV